MKKPNLLDLRPTQFALGRKEIEFKLEKMSGFTEKQLEQYCKDHVIPVVKGPGKQFYMIDHHHFARACWELKVELYEIQVIKDLSQKSENEFWNVMTQKGWVYPYDQFGMGPHSPLTLPSDIRCLADDPYRSLVWAVLEKGWILKHDLPFFEFQWATFFRRNLNFTLHSKSNFRKAIAQAKIFSRSTDARHLPGYR